MDTNPYEAPKALQSQEVDPRTIAVLHNGLLRYLAVQLGFFGVGGLSRFAFRFLDIDPYFHWGPRVGMFLMVGWFLTIFLAWVVCWALGLVRYFRLCGYPRWTLGRILLAPLAVVPPYGLIAWFLIREGLLITFVLWVIGQDGAVPTSLNSVCILRENSASP